MTPKTSARIPTTTPTGGNRSMNTRLRIPSTSAATPRPLRTVSTGAGPPPAYGSHDELGGEPGGPAGPSGGTRGSSGGTDVTAPSTSRRPPKRHHGTRPPARQAPRNSPQPADEPVPSNTAARTPRSASWRRNGTASGTSSAKPAAPVRASRDSTAQVAATAATAPAAAAGRSTAPRTTTSLALPRRPRTSTRSPPMGPSGCGDREYGNTDITRSARDAATRAVTRP